MTKSEIISNVVRDGEFFKVCSRITKAHPLTKDLFQEVLIILLEKDDQLIIEAHERGELKFLFVRIIINNFRSNNSPFAKKYRKMLEASLGFDEAFMSRELDFMLEDGLFLENEFKEKAERVRPSPEAVVLDRYDYIRIQQDIGAESDNKSLWFDRQIMRLFLKHKSIRRVSHNTGISRDFVGRSINRYIERIKNDTSFNVGAI